MLPGREIVRALRLITSPAYRREQGHIPMTVLAAMAGVDRTTLNWVRNEYRNTEDMRARLSPVIRAVLDGELRFRRNGSRGDGANRLEVVQPYPATTSRRSMASYCAWFRDIMLGQCDNFLTPYQYVALFLLR